MEPTKPTGFLAPWLRVPLYARIVTGMILGALCGLVLGPVARDFAVPSKLVLRVLGALAPPLILLAIIQALMTAQFERGTAGRLIRLLLLNTLVAFCVGFFVANVVRPGGWAKQTPPAPTHEAGTAAKPDLLHQFLENV